jgi:hypothetical protein
MDKLELRKEVIASDDKSSANADFAKLIEKKKKKITELVIKESLSGSLNLGILAEQGFIHIEILHFSPGKITAITNLPAGLKTLIIAHNLLENIDIPDSIQHLGIAHNLIKGELDFTRNTLLETLIVSHNRITSLEHLPESLEELYCDHNLLNVLSLKNTVNLRVLYAKYNPKLVLQDLPDTLVERELPENVIQTNDKQIPVSVSKNYLESVRKYFMMKDKYDEELLELKRKAKKAKRSLKHLPKCNGCGRKVGMIFSGKDQKYQAYCGNSSPCDWKIVIHRGDHYSFMETMEEMRSNLEETKENIICQKMDTLFQYISEEKSASLFKKQLSFFETNSEMAAKYYQQYLDLYFNSEKRDIIATKQKNIQELLVKIQEHLGEGQIEEVAKIQYTKIRPMAKYIQSLQYPLMSVEYFKKREEYRLDQREILLRDLEINHGEPVSIGKK